MDTPKNQSPIDAPNGSLFLTKSATAIVMGMMSWPNVPPATMTHSPKGRKITCPASWNASRGKWMNDGTVPSSWKSMAIRRHPQIARKTRSPMRAQKAVDGISVVDFFGNSSIRIRSHKASSLSWCFCLACLRWITSSPTLARITPQAGQAAGRD